MRRSFIGRCGSDPCAGRRWARPAVGPALLSVVGMVHAAFPIGRAWQAVVASGFAGQERFKVVFGDEPAASCFYRSELAGAQQVMDELPGDAQ
jgi:hypothetical protein